MSEAAPGREIVKDLPPGVTIADDGRALGRSPLVSGLIAGVAIHQAVSNERRIGELAKKLVKAHGNKYPCPGCGRTISANKDFCLSCAEERGTV